MTDFDHQPSQLLRAAADTPPNDISAAAVAKLGHRYRRRRYIGFTICAALAAVAAAVPLTLASRHNHHHQLLMNPGPSEASLAVTPSDGLANGQKVQVTVNGFPPDRAVNISECPTAPLNRVPCPPAPVVAVLRTDGSGHADGTFVVEYAPSWFITTFGMGKCAPECIATASTGAAPGAPSIVASAVLGFDSAPVSPPTSTVSAEPAGFSAAAASFISPEQGWVLGATGCAGCAGVAATTDGGRTWVSLPAPPSTLSWYSSEPDAVTDLVFADSSDGYLFAPALFETTDEGRSWANTGLSQVSSVVVSDHSVYALTGYRSNGPVALYRSAVGDNAWQKMTVPNSTPAGPKLQLTAAGGNLVLLETGFSGPEPAAGSLGRIWVSSDGGDTWQIRAAPCGFADGGASVLTIAYGHPQAWDVVCYSNNQSSQEQDTIVHVYGTADGGATWVRLGDPPQHGAPVAAADNGAGHAFIGTQGGLGDVMYGTLNGGASWPVSVQDDGSFNSWADLHFVNSQTGYVVGATHFAPDHLYRTTDGGVSWTVVPITL